MITIILNRVLVELEELKMQHTVPGTNIKFDLAYAEMESRHRASVTEGRVVQIGPDAFSDYGYVEKKPLAIGDKVQFAKFAGRVVVDPDEPNKRMAVINDEDVIAIIKSKENTNE